MKHKGEARFPTKMAIIKQQQQKTSGGEDVEKLKPCTLLKGMHNGVATAETVWWSSKN